MIQVNFFLLNPCTWEYSVVFSVNNEAPLHAQLNKLSSNIFRSNQNRQRYDDRRCCRQDEGCKFLNRSSSKFVKIGRGDRQFDTLRVSLKYVAMNSFTDDDDAFTTRC